MAAKRHDPLPPDKCIVMTNQIMISRCVQAVAVVLCALSLGGCVVVENKDPEYSEIDRQNLTLTNLSEITLVRRVIPEHSTKKAGFYVDLGQVEEISSSEFGEPNEIADLSCAIDGIRKSLPEVDIVPTEMFWERVAAQKEAMDLSELLTSPTSRRSFR